MADPTPVEIAGGISTTAVTTASFTARPAGQVLVLVMAGDAYRTTAGTGRPESTGWTYVDGYEGNLGFYVWYKVSTGETSVQYTISPASKSAYSVVALDQMAASPLGVETQSHTVVSASNTNTPIPTITPAAGDRWLVLAAGGATGNNTTGPYTWTTYAKVADRYNTAGYRPGLSTAALAINGGTATGAAAMTWAANGDQGIAVVAAFKISAGGGTSWTLAGSAVSTSATAGALVAIRVLAGTAASASTTAGALARTTSLTGSALSTSTTAAALTATSTLTGTAASASTTAGALAKTSTLTGSAASTSTTTGALGFIVGPGDLPLSAGAVSTSTTIGSVTTLGVLSGAALSGSTAAGSIAATGALAGAAVSSSATSGALVLVVPGGLTGSATSASITTGSIAAVRALSGSAASQTATTGAMTATLTVTGSAVSLSLTTGAIRLTQTWTLTGSALSISTTTGAITNSSNLRNLVLTAVVLPQRWTATVLTARWSATVNSADTAAAVLPPRLTAHMEDQ